MYCQAEANREASAWLEENWGAWYGLLQRAWYMAEMYDLDRPRREVMYDPEMRVHPYRLATQFWWKTTHGGKMIPNRCKSADALTVMGRDADAALAWSQNFSNGLQRSLTRGFPRYVRAIRAFACTIPR